MAASGSDAFLQPYPRGDYHETIILRKSQRPGLEVLERFMETERKVPVNPILQLERTFDIEVVHILDSGALEDPIKCKTRESFNNAMEAASGRVSTFVLVENLSPAAIETLGINFKLAPEFFALHLQGTQCFRTGEWLPPKYTELELLPSYYEKAPFYSLQICRPYQLTKGLKEVNRLRKTETNTPRGVYFVERLGNGAMQERVSVYTTTDKNNKNMDIGIIVTDRLLKLHKPLTFSIDPVTAFDFDNDKQQLPHGHRDEHFEEQISCREMVKRWLSMLAEKDRITAFDHREILAIYPLISLISAASSTFWFDARLYLNRIANKQHDIEFLDDPGFSLDVTRRLHKNIHHLQRHLEQNRQIIVARAPKLAEELTLDIVFLEREMQSLLRRVEADLQFLASNLSFLQAKLVNVLTKVAILFLPITTVAAVLAIPGDTHRFLIFGAITAPFVAIFGFFMFSWALIISLGWGEIKTRLMRC